MQPKSVVHEKQVQKTFEVESTSRVGEMKSWGCKVLKWGDIMQRKHRNDKEKGRVVVAPGAHGASFGRSASRGDLPPVPIGGFIPPSPQAAGVFSGVAPEKGAGTGVGPTGGAGTGPAGPSVMTTRT